MNYRKKAILMVMALFCLNIAILAQAVSLKMDNVSVKEAMTQLKNKSGYSFVYKVGDLDTKKIILYFSLYSYFSFFKVKQS